jgi:hypothetical protein
MIKVIQEVKHTCFIQTIKNHKWENVMDEEMTTLNANVIWELMILSKNKKNN